jgi:hypothetical protein
MTSAPIPAAPAAVHPFLDFNDVAPVRYEKDDIRARLLEQLESVLISLFPHGKRRGTQFFVGNLQGDPGDSLVIELDGPKRGVRIDFATGESGDVLTTEERAVYDDLRFDRLQPRVRLEQERVGFGCLSAQLRSSLR